MTKIEWTDVTWNPVRGCSRVSEGCRLSRPTRMTVEVASRPTAGVETKECFTTAASARHVVVRLTRKSSAMADGPLQYPMVRYGFDDLKVLWTVVISAAVQVMDLLAVSQRAADLAFSHQAVLIDVPANVRVGMLGQPNEHVSVGREGATALPVRVSCARMNYSHTFQSSTKGCRSGSARG